MGQTIVLDLAQLLGLVVGLGGRGPSFRGSLVVVSAADVEPQSFVAKGPHGLAGRQESLDEVRNIEAPFARNELQRLGLENIDPHADR